MPGGWEWLVIVVVLLVLFGAKRLPDMARSVGQSARVFKGEMKGLRDDEGRTAPPSTRPGASTDPPPPAAPVHEQVNGAGPAAAPGVGAAGQQPGGPARPDPVRPDADR